MTVLSSIRILTVCAAAASVTLLVNSAAAEPSAGAAEAKPLKLRTFMRKPVASSATRTVKKKDGEYAKVAVKRRAKARVAAAPVTLTTPAAISPTAAQAFAAYELARVRVVTAEDADDARHGAVVAVDNVQIVSADEVNEIDRKADSPRAVSLDALSRDLASRDFEFATASNGESENWLQRMLMVFGSAFAGIAALVRILLG